MTGNGMRTPSTSAASRVVPIDYAGQWIAWNPTGTRVVASASDPEDLEDLVRRAGQDPGLCVIEGIPDSDSVLGGGSLNLEQV